MTAGGGPCSRHLKCMIRDAARIIQCTRQSPQEVSSPKRSQCQDSRPVQNIFFFYFGCLFSMWSVSLNQQRFTENQAWAKLCARHILTRLIYLVACCHSPKATPILKYCPTLSTSSHGFPFLPDASLSSLEVRHAVCQSKDLY